LHVCFLNLLHKNDRFRSSIGSIDLKKGKMSHADGIINVAIRTLAVLSFVSFST
jgi:hypothetical protein